jgi:ubiquinone/menaquinone biosynthesis C-methylase UbiE
LQPPTASRPQWQRPRGVSPGTWDYVNERSIADRYDAFVADTPLCRVDDQVLSERLPGVAAGQPEVVLDLGCGSGRSALPLAGRGYHVVAVDLSLPMLQVLTHKTLDATLIGRVDPVHANLVELNCFAENSADHAICMFSTLGMIQARANRREMLRHVARIVRPGGSFIVHVHNRWAALRERHGVWSLASSFWRSLRAPEVEFGDATYAYRGLQNMFMHRYSKRELVRDLEETAWIIDILSPVSIDGSQIDPQAKIPGGFIVVATLPRA